MALSEYLINKREMSEKDYKYARVGFIADSAFYNSSLSFLMGAYLTGLLALVGSTEAQTNLILSLPTTLAFLQLVFPVLFGNIIHKKSIVFFCRAAEIPPLAICFFIPLTSVSTNTAIILIGILVLIKHIAGWLYNPYYTDMLMNCLSKHGKIGKFSGIQTTINSIVTCVALFFAGQITKHHIGGTEKIGYMWLGIIAIVLWVAQITFLFFIKEPFSPVKKDEEPTKFTRIFKDLFTVPAIRTFLLFDTLYLTGITVSNALTNIMCVQRLGMSLETISYLTIAEFFLRIILMPIFGRITDKFGAKKMLITGILFMTSVFLLHGIMTPSNMIILKAISSFLSCIGLALISVSSLPYTFDALPAKNRATYLACNSVFKNFVCSTVSFSVTLFMSIAHGMNIECFGFIFNELNTMLFFGSFITLGASIPLLKIKKHH